MIDDFNKRQRVIDLGEEAEDEILESTGKTESAFDTPQYRRVMEVCKERDKIPTQAWTPDEEENPEEFMESVYKNELGSSFETIENGVGVGNYESEFNQKTMERKGADTCPKETIGQNSEEDIC